MSQQLDKKSILKKTAQFGGATFLSRILGIVRDVLRVRFLGVGAISDAFIIAFKVPNFLRRIFAEGALSASFVPVFIKKTKNKELENGNGLMSVSFLFFEGIVFLLTLLVMIYPHGLLNFIAPGFSAEALGPGGDGLHRPAAGSHTQPGGKGVTGPEVHRGQAQRDGPEGGHLRCQA